LVEDVIPVGDPISKFVEVAFVEEFQDLDAYEAS
jgi:hypothetical protein